MNINCRTMIANSIGGYFSLELPFLMEYHPLQAMIEGDEHAFLCLRLNTGRNCLEYILRSRQYRKVYIPYYTCDVVLEPFQKLNVEYAFYHIDQNLEIIDEISLQKGEALLYTNYYGLKQRYVERLAEHFGQRLIVDNTQAFYAKPIMDTDTFYTCRKFFGVPDGAYVYTNKPLGQEIEQDVSWDRMSYLNKRIDLGAEAGYADFRQESEKFKGQPIKRMSNLTHRMMQSIDYDDAAIKRRRNYMILQEALGKSNLLNLRLEEDAVPLVYPFMIDVKGLREFLILHKVFVARYWPNVLKCTEPSDFEYVITSFMLPLPCDQRYSENDMKRVVNVINSFE